MGNRQGSFDKKFTWIIEKFSEKDDKKLRSKAFEFCGYRWRIHVGKKANHLSLHLKVADSLPPYGWSRSASFSLALINQLDSNHSIERGTENKKFNGGCQSCGSTFVHLSDFYDPMKGYLVNDTCIVVAHLFSPQFSAIQTNTIAPEEDEPILESSDDALSSTTHDSSQNDSTTTSSTLNHDSSHSEEELLEGHQQVDQYSDLTLITDLIDFKGLCREEEEVFFPLLEQVCSWHPSLLHSQREKSSWFVLWAFTTLGQVLYFLKTTKVRDMNDDACRKLRGLWNELTEDSGFDLTWLEPYVQLALKANSCLKTAERVKRLRENVAALEVKVKSPREMGALEELTEKRRELAEAEKCLQEVDMDAELGYGIY